MKKNLLSFFILFVFILPIYANDELHSENIPKYVNKCIALLGKSVPNGFQRLDRTMFINDEDIMIIVENGIIVMSSFGDAFETTHDASALNGLFYDYFENSRNNWKFICSTYYGTDVYLRNGIYAEIFKGQRRDGLIVSLLKFRRNINDL
jgi:hypothetical protein